GLLGDRPGRFDVTRLSRKGGPGGLAQAGDRHPGVRGDLITMEICRRPKRFVSSLVLPFALAASLASFGTPAAMAGTAAAAPHAQYDECESDLIAFVGSDVYQFSPA